MKRGEVRRQRSDRSNLPWPPTWLPWLAVVIGLLIWPFVGYGAWKAWQKNHNRVEDWLPDSFPETRKLYEFADRFGSDEFLLVSWPGCTVDDPRCLRLAQRLLDRSDNGIAYISNALTAPDVLESLQNISPSIGEQSARRRLSGLFLGSDLDRSCVVAVVSPLGLEDRPAAIDWVWKVAEEVTRLPRADIHLAGTTADAVAVNQASMEGLLQLNLVSFAICLLILALALRSVWLVAAVFLSALFNEQLALAIIYFSGSAVDSVLLLVANLSFVLTISAGLHYLGYFRESVRSGVRSPSLDAIRNALVPSVLAAATTSIGFLSLCTSEVVPIRRFGIYAAIVVPINAFLIVTILAIHAGWASRRNWRGRAVPVASAGTPSHNRWSRPLVAVLQKSPWAVIVVWIAVVSVLGWGVTRLKTSVGTRTLLSAEDKLVGDYTWLESYIGALVPIEVVFKVNNSRALDPLDAVKALQMLRRELQTIPAIETTWSVLNCLPPVPPPGGISHTVRRTLFSQSVAKAEDEFRQMRLFYSDPTEQCWRISGRVSGSKPHDYTQLLADVDHVVHRFREQVGGDGIEVEISGGVPFIYRTQRQLLKDLLNSFGAAFLMIAATMSLLFRSVSAGVFSMIPNLTPAAVVFGFMGWAGLDVELGTVLTASVIMGVCVDDTLHLIAHFRNARAAGLEVAEAVQEAQANCGGPMVQTSMICGLGMLAFALSPFVPVARFGFLTFSLLMVGLISDLILTPAILLSPLNRCFYRTNKRHEFVSLRAPTPQLTANPSARAGVET